MENSEFLNLNAKFLKLFLTVLDSQSVSKAADELDLNQSTVSYGLERLRAAFKDPLFVKQGRGIAPTAKAQTIAPHIREILLELEGLSSDEKYKPSTDTSTFTIATNVMELLPYCKSIHRAFLVSSPNASMRFLELGSRANIRNILETQAADIIISVRPSELPKALDSSPLLSFEQVCFFDQKIRGPIGSVQEYCDANHAVLDFGCTAKSTIDLTLDALSMTRKIRLKAPNVQALSALIKGTDFITTMQIDLHKHAMNELDFCKPPISIPPVNFDLIWHRRSSHSGRQTWFRNLIADVVKPTP